MHDLSTSGAVPAAEILHPSNFPRTYRVSTGNRVLYSVLGAVVLAGGLAGMWYFGTGHEAETATEALALAAVCFAFVLLGAALILYMLTTRIVLSADAIELCDFLRARKLRRDDIAGRRLVDAQYVSVLSLIPKRAGAKPLKITQIMRTDPALEAWVATLPDLDARELEQSATEIAANRALGRTPEERAARLASAQKAAKALSVVAGGVSLWGFFFPDPYYEVVIATLAALPLLAVVLVARSGNLYQVAGSRNDARASLAVVFIGPGLVLGLRAILDIQLLDWAPALGATALLALAVTAVLAVVDKTLRGHRAELLAMLFISSFWAYGSVLESNALFDRSQPQVFETTVTGKRKSTGRSTSYYLRLEPWGPRREVDEVSVYRDLYDATAAGQRVCVVYRAGALQMPWFTVHRCRGG